MLIPMYYLKDCDTRLRAMQRMLEKIKDDEEVSVEMGVIISNFHGIAFDMANALSELSFGLKKSHGFNSSLSLLKNLWDTISSESTKKQLFDAINTLISMFENYDYNDADLRDYNDIFLRLYHYGDDIVDSNFAESFSKTIKLQVPRIVNIIDPICRSGADSISFHDSFSGGTPRLWGIGLNDRTQSIVKSRFHKTVSGGLKGSNITNDVFDVLLVRPNISLSRSGEKLFFKREKEMLQRSINYVRPGGAVSICLPYFRFYRDIVIMLSKFLSNIQIRKVDNSLSSQLGLVYVTGIKKETRDIDEDGYTALRHSFKYEEILDLEEHPLEDILLPAGIKEVKTFRGSVLDQEEIKRIYADSSCVSQFWESQKVEKLSENTKNPLLPFSVGQLGLVLTSGCLDGVVEEGNGYCHVIKGRVVKKLDCVKDIDAENKQIEITETTSNRVEINVFLPDGTFKVLA